MKATITGLAALLLALALATAAQAWFENGPTPYNAFSPSYCCPYWDMGSYGSYGAINNWPPCGQPYQGMQGFRPNVPMGSGNCGYRFARSPRDYFMVDP